MMSKPLNGSYCTVFSILVCMVISIALFLAVPIAHATVWTFPTRDEDGNTIVERLDENGDLVVERTSADGTVTVLSGDELADYEAARAERAAEYRAKEIEGCIANGQVERARAFYVASDELTKSKVSSQSVQILEQADEQSESSATSNNDPDDSSFKNGLIAVLLSIYLIVFYIQIFMAYGTAYRKTKAGGDTGVALFGWMVVFGLAAYIPGLGIYLWNRSKS